jgi:nicotinamidase/pyrazinamidase
MSFVSLWPKHCVQNTHGAEFHPNLNIASITKIIQKGMDHNIDSYSAFYDNDYSKSTGLTRWLREKNISILYVMGLATEYCVKFSCLDAIADDFSVYLIEDGCRGVNLQENDIENALTEMQDKGIQLINSRTIQGVK